MHRGVPVSRGLFKTRARASNAPRDVLTQLRKAVFFHWLDI